MTLIEFLKELLYIEIIFLSLILLLMGLLLPLPCTLSTLCGIFLLLVVREALLGHQVRSCSCLCSAQQDCDSSLSLSTFQKAFFLLRFEIMVKPTKWEEISNEAFKNVCGRLSVSSEAQLEHPRPIRELLHPWICCRCQLPTNVHPRRELVMAHGRWLPATHVEDLH